MGVDHRGHRVGRVVKAIDELKAQGDQQGHPEQQEGRPGGDHRTGGVDVAKQAPGGIEQSAQQ
ncbi:hypothetical protein D9M71_780980 [compost metagenome]